MNLVAEIVPATHKSQMQIMLKNQIQFNYEEEDLTERSIMSWIGIVDKM